MPDASAPDRAAPRHCFGSASLGVGTPAPTEAETRGRILDRDRERGGARAGAGAAACGIEAPVLAAILAEDVQPLVAEVEA
jgi:hypothetical protein